MKKPGEGGQTGDGNGSNPACREKNAGVNSSVHHESPVCRRPRRKANLKVTIVPNPSISSAFGKFTRKRSHQIALPSSDTNIHPSKKSYQQSKTKTGEEMSSHDQSSIEFGTEESNKGTRDSLTIRTKALVIHCSGVSGVAIPTAALASFRLFSHPQKLHSGSPFAPSKKKSIEEDEVYESGLNTAGPHDAHRHFDFSLHNSLSPDDFRQSYLLKTVDKPQVSNPSTYRSISADVLKVLISEMSPQDFQSRFVLIDCRYPYEYEGGHIKHAINLHDRRKIESIFYPDDEKSFTEINEKIPIFYCEFSQKRGPRMAMQLRKCDRGQSTERWPHVDYQEIYILDKGYKEFFCQFKDCCVPSDYVPMTHPGYASQLKKYDHHKKRTERSMMLCDKSLMNQLGDLDWDAPSSRPPLSPVAVSPRPLDDGDANATEKKN